jgi:hypothetical protein
MQSNSEIKLYLDGSYYNSIPASIDGDVEAYLTSLDNADGQTVGAKVDELKLWNRALSSDEIESIYQNEKNGNNYDSSPRNIVECSASIAEHSWELVGIPADLRQGSFTIDNIFGDDMNGTYGIDWRIYTREYNETDNNSSYRYLSEINTTLEFGKGYWLGSKKSSSWDVNDIIGVDYDSTSDACVASSCVELDVKSVSLDENVDDLNGTGPYRYYMTGFVGKAPVDWADCRFIIDGVAYTPSDADTAGYINKQIWQYNPNSSDADSKGYTTCDDVTPGSCKLIPYKGFWIEMQGPTKGKTVKLLIPKG